MLQTPEEFAAEVKASTELEWSVDLKRRPFAPHPHSRYARPGAKKTRRKSHYPWARGGGRSVRYRSSLEGLSPPADTINLHLYAIRRLADESVENGRLSPELASGI